MHTQTSHETSHGELISDECDECADQTHIRVTDVFQAAISPRPVPMALEAVRAGFPSVAQDYFAGDFSFDENVITNPDTTFILHVAGDSMEGAGIFDGDLLIVDRSISPAANDIVVAILDDELTVKRLLVHGTTPILHPENSRYPDFIPSDDESLSIWGVGTGNFPSQHDAASRRNARNVPRIGIPSPQRVNDARDDRSRNGLPQASIPRLDGQLRQDPQRYPKSGWGA
ncbi:MAG: S24 family peptidase [Bifidobacterium sp.]